MKSTEKAADSWLSYSSWVLFIGVIVVSSLAWYVAASEGTRWTWIGIFPLLGILAWVSMWTHYMSGALQLFGYKQLGHRAYSSFTSGLVLLLILAHPTILALNQWIYTDRLPPGSFYSYVESSLAFFVFLGSLSLLVFLSYEYFNRAKEKAWVKKRWFIISMTQMFAMTAIWVHALFLGSTIGELDWFKFIWVILGASLVVAFGLLGREDYLQAKKCKEKHESSLE